MSNARSPYHAQPDHAFWKRAVSDKPAAEVDPAITFDLTIDRSTKVVTAGSCFAQHIARHLKKQRFNYFVTEPPHPNLGADVCEAFNYGTFSARYGNIYTARQLRQLFDRAYGAFQPVEDVWEESDGRFVDPFRPNIQPGGFSSRREFDLDRGQHFAAVRRALEELDVFVFTLGLTECWTHAGDGAVFPLCPGVAGGTFDPAVHRFVNLTVDEVVEDMRAALARLRAVNPASKVILTVSPVPLIATAEQQHVLTATTYSKAVLRVAAETLTRTVPEVHYFPSYEVITGPHAAGGYFAANRRDVLEEGVSHVMRLFFQHAADMKSAAIVPKAPEKPNVADMMESVVDVICDEHVIQDAVGM